MMTAYGTLQVAVEAMRLGAYDYIGKPFDTDEVLLVVQKALEAPALALEVARLRPTGGGGGAPPRRSPARPSRASSWRASSSATRRAPLRGPWRHDAAASSRRKAARS